MYPIRQWMQNSNWRPYNGTDHGLHHRIFVNDEESSIAEHIRDNFIGPGFVFQNQNFQRIASHAYIEKHKEDDLVMITNSR